MKYPDIDGKDYEEINSYSSGDYTKYRMKSRDVTVDIAVIETELDRYRSQRKEELQDMETKVPAPYTSRTETRERDDEYPLEFGEQGGQQYGLGYAGPEYKLMFSDSGQIPRYRYFITWREDEGSVVEIELYIPQEEFDLDRAFEISGSVSI